MRIREGDDFLRAGIRVEHISELLEALSHIRGRVAGPNADTSAELLIHRQLGTSCIIQSLI